MSLYASKLAQKEYRAAFKEGYQQGARLAGKVRRASGVVGNTKQFKVYDKIEATEQAPRTEVAVANQDYRTPEAVLKFYAAADLVSISEEQEHDQSERAILPRNIGKACGRREDQIVIKAMDDEVNKSVGGSTNIVKTGSGSFSLPTAGNVRPSGIQTPHGLLAATREKMLDAGIPEDKRVHCLLPATWYAAFLDDPQIVTRETQGGGASMPTRTGMVAPQYNCDIIFMEQRKSTAAGGSDLYDTAGTPTGYMWDMEAVGLAIGLERRGRTDWIAKELSWFVVQWFKAGACVIDRPGVWGMQVAA